MLRDSAALSRLPVRNSVLLNTYVPTDKTMERTVFGVNKYDTDNVRSLARGSHVEFIILDSSNEESDWKIRERE